MPDWSKNGRGTTGPTTRQMVAAEDVDYADPANQPTDGHGGKYGPPRAVACNTSGDAWVWLLDEDPATDPSVKRAFVAGSEYATSIREIDGSETNTAELVLLF